MTIQMQLGHSNIKTTMAYIQFTPEMHRRKYDVFCPRYLEDELENCLALGAPIAGMNGRKLSGALHQRQKLALSYLKTHGQIANKIYAGLAHVGHKTACMDLTDLCQRGMIRRAGNGRGSYYTIALLPSAMGLP